jgi:hypothetical protein
MPYNDFSLETVSSILGVNADPADLFPHVEPIPVPVWLREMLDQAGREGRAPEGEGVSADAGGGARSAVTL